MVEPRVRRDAPALVLASAGLARRRHRHRRRPAGRAVRPAGADDRPAPGEDGGLPVGHGSGRSVPGFALHEALKACADCCRSRRPRGGGGLQGRAPTPSTPSASSSVPTRRPHFPDGPPAPQLVLDAEVPLARLTLGLLKEIDRLEPYGGENPRPLFLAGGLEVQGEPRRMGGGERHMSFRVQPERHRRCGPSPSAWPSASKS